MPPFLFCVKQFRHAGSSSCVDLGSGADNGMDRSQEMSSGHEFAVEYEVLYF